MIKAKIEDRKFWEGWVVSVKEKNILVFMDSRREARLVKKALEVMLNA